jgi:hypothetical protein
MLGFLTLSILPAPLRPYIYGAIALLVVFVGIWIYGERKYVQGEDHVTNQLLARQVKVQKASQQVTEKIITQYVPQVQYIQGKTQTIIKKVPVYVTQVDDSHCTIPNSFVWLWNNANQMQLPGDTVTVPGGASDVILSEVAAQHAQETGICLANEARIRATTEWLKQQQALYDR